MLKLLFVAFLVAAACACGAPTQHARTEASSSADRAGDAGEKPLDPSRAPQGFGAAHALDVLATDQGHAVILANADETIFLPIFVGQTEALSIRLRMQRRRFERPLTHDLLDEIVDELGGEILKVHVDGLKGGIFVGRIFIHDDGHTIEIDARPSDAIAIALGQGIPIYVADDVMRDAGLRREDLEDQAGDRAEEPAPTEQL